MKTEPSRCSWADMLTYTPWSCPPCIGINGSARNSRAASSTSRMTGKTGLPEDACSGFEAGGQEVADCRCEQQARDDRDPGVECTEREQGDGNVRDGDDGQEAEIERPKERKVLRLLARRARPLQSVGLPSEGSARLRGPVQMGL